jgi:hypothetical protein
MGQESLLYHRRILGELRTVSIARYFRHRARDAAICLAADDHRMPRDPFCPGVPSARGHRTWIRRYQRLWNQTFSGCWTM